jgi:purine-binding chemotaxis protein CheW
MVAQPGSDAPMVAEAKAGKYLTFVLAGEGYGLEILGVREIMGMMDITSIPRTPDFVRGVMNLRGKVIPVIDLRLRFGMEAGEVTEQTCIIVVDICDSEVGIVVDEVHEVLDIAAEDIEGPPSFGVEAETNFIMGMGKADDKVTILLDIARVLTGEDLQSLGVSV